MLFLEVILLLVFTGLLLITGFAVVDDFNHSGVKVLRDRQFRLNLVAFAFSAYLVLKVVQTLI